MTAETFLALCYKAGLTRADLEEMTVGMCVDFIDTYIELQTPADKKPRKATQADFDAF